MARCEGVGRVAWDGGIDVVRIAKCVRLGTVVLKLAVSARV